MVYQASLVKVGAMSPRHPVVNLWGMLTTITPYRAYRSVHESQRAHGSVRCPTEIGNSLCRRASPAPRLMTCCCTEAPRQGRKIEVFFSFQTQQKRSRWGSNPSPLPCLGAEGFRVRQRVGNISAYSHIFFICVYRAFTSFTQVAARLRQAPCTGYRRSE